PLLLLGIWIKNFRRIEEPKAFFQKVITAIQKIPRGILLHFIWVVLLNLYSFYLGTFNLESIGDQPPLSHRYTLLWQGLYHEYIWNDYHPAPLGILFMLLFINTGFLVAFVEKAKRRRHLNAFFLYVVFFLAYTLLLPLGGYRTYRPFILRYDVIMPTTIGLWFLFFNSCYLLFNYFKGAKQVVYGSLLMSLLVFLSIIDRIPTPPTNVCEYSAIEQLANSKEKIVALPACQILSWFLVSNPNDSETQSKLLYRWNIIKDKEQRYRNK
ncbi:MAG: hypothetical protein ACRBFS_26445, partial [Aureispira sp.]